MKKLLVNAIAHPLISGSAIIFIGSNAANAFNLLFNFYMVRNLSDADFGVLTSLNSMIVLPLLVATGLSPIVVNFAADYFAQNRIDLVHGFYVKMAKYYFLLCAILFIIFMIFTNQIASFFHISQLDLVILTGVIALIGLITTLNVSFLQAKLAFLFISIILLISAVAKVVFGVSFVLFGMSVAGGMWALFLASVILYLVSFIPLRFLFKKNLTSSAIPTKELFSYGFPAGISILGLTLFITTDIFLVKHFFSPESAGVYASIELVGKIVYFLTSSISIVMFPIIVQKRTKGEPYHKTLLLSCALVLIPSFIITLLYFLFPDEIIRLIIKKESVLIHSSLLGIFGILMTLYSFVGLLTYFYLSIKKTKVSFLIMGAALLQVVVIWIYHASFLQVIYGTLFVILLLLVALLLYYPHATKK